MNYHLSHRGGRRKKKNKSFGSLNSVAFILVIVQIRSVCRFLRDGELNSEKNPFFRMAHKKIYLLTGVQFRLLFNSAFLAFGAK